MFFLNNGKDGAIAGFQTPVAPAAIKGTRETILTVDAGESTIFRIVLLSAFNVGLVEIVGC